MISSPGRGGDQQRQTARVAPAGINLGEPAANIRPKPRIAWHRRPLFSPGLDGDHLVENLEGPGGEEWTFREHTHSQSVKTSVAMPMQELFMYLSGSGWPQYSPR